MPIARSTPIFVVSQRKGSSLRFRQDQSKKGYQIQKLSWLHHKAARMRSSSSIFKDRKVLLWFTLALTYVRTYILTNKSLLKKSSYTKTSLTKKVPNDTSTCSKFFFRGRNPKNDRDRAKKPSFLTKNCGLSVFS